MKFLAQDVAAFRHSFLKPKQSRFPPDQHEPPCLPFRSRSPRAALYVELSVSRNARPLRLSNAIYYQLLGGTVRIHALAILFCSSMLYGGPIGFAEVGGFIQGNGGLIAQLDQSSTSYFTTLDANNLGTFGWMFRNTSGAPIANATFLVFLDADIDRSSDTYFNEYGQFVSLDLPPGSPSGAIRASSWEIDEPGFVFGDIYSNLLAGFLDSTNAVPSSAPDDVSLALGFALGVLPPGQTVTITAMTSVTAIGGLSQSDPASPHTFYFNAHATTDGTPSEVPEPKSTGLILVGLVAMVALARRRCDR